jgi:membrane-associated phospholipid phosphatase
MAGNGTSATPGWEPRWLAADDALLGNAEQVADRHRWRSACIAGLFLLAAAVALRFDVTCAQWCARTEWPAALEKLFLLSEVFGHAIGILVIGLLVFQLDPIRRWSVPRVVFTAIGAGVIADIVKLFVARARPRQCELEKCAWDMVAGFFAPGTAGISHQSFPSGHAAAAVALAFALAALYPRGRSIFFALAILASGQRLLEGSHYLTDVFVGMAIGAACAAVCLDVGPLAALFDRRESAWRAVIERWSESSAPWRRFWPRGSRRAS